MGRMIAMLGSFALALDRSGRAAKENPMKDPDSEVKCRGTRANPSTPSYKRPLSEEYDTFRRGLANEEMKAFYARLVVAWAFFIIFWTVRLACPMKF
jgi:hypothetical protein